MSGITVVLTEDSAVGEEFCRGRVTAVPEDGDGSYLVGDVVIFRTRDAAPTEEGSRNFVVPPDRVTGFVYFADDDDDDWDDDWDDDDDDFEDDWRDDDEDDTDLYDGSDEDE